MIAASFPTDDYTPHGYLANPFAVSRSWSEGRGGNLRSTEEGIGFGWLYPWTRGATAGAALQIAIRHGRRWLVSRADFEAIGLGSPYHSSNLFEYRWALSDYEWVARFVLVDEHELGLEVECASATRPAHAGLPSSPHPDPLPEGEGRGEGFVLYILAVGWRADGGVRLANPDARSPLSTIDLGSPFGTHRLFVDAGAFPISALNAVPDELHPHARTSSQESAPAVEPIVGGAAISIPEHSTTDIRIFATLHRQPDSTEQPPGPRPPVIAVPPAIERARARDDQFWSRAARLEGDWPPSWRRGWIYDLETTRMCVFPAGGVFRDAWPAWMVQWPRVVLAEGSLDALRLSYGDPSLAQTIALTMLRDATAPNVPCVFQHGEPNMVANDGSICGTSPAWCVPFYNLERLYLRTLDRDWLADIYPPLDRYLRWWLAERTDRLGWAVYKCTWEAGEDDTPRLDPERRGDNVVSEFVRPVELQATMALSAEVLARFATELGRPDDAAYWRSVTRSFAERTQQLWDPRTLRFRDWDCRREQFLESSGETNYWGVDPCRHSVLSLTPILAGLATPRQRDAMLPEIAEYARPPWTLWPSWSYVLLESALAAGQRELAGRIAAGIVGRVYDELDRRAPGQPRGPTPGVAREYWPLDLSDWNACEGYGWGATTASFLVRQIFGFLESKDTTGLQFRLAPWLPDELLVPGRTYTIVNLPYRGHALDIAYTVRDKLARPGGTGRSVLVNIASQRPSRCKVVAAEGISRLTSSAPRSSHRFAAGLGEIFDMKLTFD